MLVSSPNGVVYYVDDQHVMPEAGTVDVVVIATKRARRNNDPGTTLTVSSAKYPGLDSEAVVGPEGLAGGAEAETDPEYLSRVLTFVRTGARYGKKGDFAAWAVDSTAEVKRAFEIRNYSIFGALLIQVIGGQPDDGGAAGFRPGGRHGLHRIGGTAGPF